MNIQARPISKERIESQALSVRKQYNIVLPFLSIIELYDKIDKYEIRTKNDDLMSENELAYYNIEEAKIYILEEVYNNAVNNTPRDRFTLAHELGHYYLHEKFNLDINSSKYKNKVYCDPEWQANEFAGCLLAPRKLVLEYCKTIQDIQNIFVVSFDCAQKRYEKILYKKYANLNSNLN